VETFGIHGADLLERSEGEGPVVKPDLDRSSLDQAFGRFIWHVVGVLETKGG
jgi:hypothetical protein